MMVALESVGQLVAKMELCSGNLMGFLQLVDLTVAYWAEWMAV